jgi:hypothetical protein
MRWLWPRWLGAKQDSALLGARGAVASFCKQYARSCAVRQSFSQTRARLVVSARSTREGLRQRVNEVLCGGAESSSRAWWMTASHEATPFAGAKRSKQINKAARSNHGFSIRKGPCKASSCKKRDDAALASPRRIVQRSDVADDAAAPVAHLWRAGLGEAGRGIASACEAEGSPPRRGSRILTCTAQRIPVTSLWSIMPTE